MTLLSLSHAAVAILISATVVVWTVTRIVRGRLDLREDLPLNLCNLSALLAPLSALTSSQLSIAWSVCVGGPGGLVGVMMPDLGTHHDRSTHVKFWIVHYGIMVCCVLSSFKQGPSGPGQLAWLLVAAAGMIPLAALANKLLDANYLFLRSKPSTPSLLDHFGSWPLYIALMIATAAAVILLIYALWSVLWGGT